MLFRTRFVNIGEKGDVKIMSKRSVREYELVRGQFVTNQTSNIRNIVFFFFCFLVSVQAVSEIFDAVRMLIHP